MQYNVPQVWPLVNNLKALKKKPNLFKNSIKVFTKVLYLLDSYPQKEQKI